MTYKRLDGNCLSRLLQQDIRSKVDNLANAGKRTPGLGVIIVGNNPASQSYVKRKEKVAEKECGFLTKDIKLPEDCNQQTLSEAINKFNTDPEIDGILLQLPLPRHLDSNQFIEQILPAKDADGLHPLNQGLMLRGDGELLPCTPQGALSMIDLALSDYDFSESKDFQFSDIPEADLSGKTAIIIGRSILVGKPLHSLLLARNCTVIQAHSRTKDLAELTKTADIVIAAVGVPELVKSDWIKPKAIVIDVGINRKKTGGLIGDVEFEASSEIASAITPVPGGVGPMTVAMLMKNTLTAYLKQF